MKYKQFKSWCNERAADGCWAMRDAVVCDKVIELVDKMQFWKRERTWRKLDDIYGIVQNIVEPTNEKIREAQGGEKV